jgi:hypothetical protein
VYEKSFNIEIHDATRNVRTVTIKANGTKSLAELKQDIYAVTDIPAHQQRWANWPPTSGAAPDGAFDNDRILGTCEWMRPDETFILIVDDRNAPAPSATQNGPAEPLSE